MKRNYITPEEFSKSLNSIHHRGPDEQGIVNLKNATLGFKRLSIIDLEGGSQPMQSICGNYFIVFNGEIYNFIELKNELINLGVDFRTHSDTEVILNLYIEYGESFINRLRGMFSFAILDLLRNHIYCARDGFGIKPFYYSEDDNCIVFASELKAIQNIKKLSLSVSPFAVDNYFTFGYIPREYTVFSNVKKLLSGHTIKFYLDGSKSEVKEFWSPSFDIQPVNDEEYLIKLLDKQLNESVKKHLISDVDVGAFLSGGVDSSLVVAMAAMEMKTKLKTFSIGFNDINYNELPFARAVSRQYNTEHHELTLNPESISVIEDIVRMTDEPFADSSILPTFFVSKLASQSVKVVLSGDGGDELFGGYNMYDKMLKLKKYNLFSKSKLFRDAMLQLAKAMPYSSNHKRILYFLSKRVEYIAAYTSLWTQIDRKWLFNEDFRNKLGGLYSESLSEGMLDSDIGMPFMDRIQKFNMQFVLIDDILTKVDRASMYNSLEVRVPILDKEIQKVSAMTPYNLRFRNGDKKYLLKKVAEKYLPNDIIYRRKQGFSVPLDFWFKENLLEYLKGEVLYSSQSIFNYLNKDFVGKIINLHSKGKVDYSSHLWSVIIFHKWLEINRNV